MRGYRIELGEIEAELLRHAGVREAVVITREEIAGDKRLIAYIVPEPEASHAESSDPRWNDERVSHWKKVYEDVVYSDLASDKDTDQAVEGAGGQAFNFVGWNSSFTGQPIPADEMRNWLDNTVARIRALKPRKVLEIGCGTGLILFNVAADCEYYCGVDLSEAALDYVHQQLDPLGLSQVELLHRTAGNISDLATGDFDLVILNSVVQYFPSVDYLLRVIATAIEAIGDQGAIFIGDVRDFTLLQDFHNSVEFFKASDSLKIDQLKQRIQRRILEEQELVIDPVFFNALRQHFPSVSGVEIRPKRGRVKNELTQFRYDVTLLVGMHETTEGTESRSLNWQKEGMTLNTIRQQLIDDEPEAFTVTQVPNGRLFKERFLQNRLAAATSMQTVGEVREVLKSVKPTGVLPSDFAAMEEELPYDVHLRFSSQGNAGNFDVLFQRKGTPAQVVASFYHSVPKRQRAWYLYANNPLQGALSEELIPKLREQLQDRLPEYMIPSVYVLLDSMPIMPNGKVNRRNLPVPDVERPSIDTDYVAPRTPVEERMANIWADMLQLEGVGIYDDFFADLGGHSLLATQLMSRIRTSFGVDLSLRRLFETPTVAALTEAVSQLQPTLSGESETIRPQSSIPSATSVEELSDEEVDALLKRMMEAP